MRGNRKIRDLKLFVEMIKTKSRKEIAEHFGTTEVTVTRTAALNGFSLTDIRREHRKEFINCNPALGVEQLAEALNCSPFTLARAISNGVYDV